MRYTLADIDVAYLRSILRYETETGFFWWLHRDDVGAQWNTKFAGKRAGKKTKNEPNRIGINGRRYKTCRLAWLYMTGEWPKDLVDHEDRDFTNDRWVNLRASTSSQNNANQTARVDNKLGVKGVHWRDDLRKYAAGICVRGKQIHLGYFVCPDEAYAAYMTAAKQHFKEFARSA